MTLHVAQRDSGRYGSNRHVFIEALDKAYSPDASVVKRQPTPFTYAAGKEAYTNPKGRRIKYPKHLLYICQASHFYYLSN